jgi:oligopeptide transport system substrate-binding protein
VFFPVNKALDEESPAWAFNAHKNFLCNGPFILSEWKHHNEIIVKKNPLFREPGEVQLETIRFSIITNEMTSLQMYENGELDFVGHPFSTLPSDAIKPLHQKQELKTTPAAATTFITFNTEKSWFGNENLRKAFAYAIHRQEIVENMTQLGEVVATGAIPPILKNNCLSTYYIDNQQDLARSYLQKALSELHISKKDLGQLTFLYSSIESHHKVAQVLQQQWLKALGVHVQLQAMEHKILLDRLSKRDYSFGLTIWRAQYHDPLSILERFKHKENIKNYSGWENEEFKTLLNKSAFETGDQRSATLEKAEHIFLKELPVAPLYHWSFCYLSRPYLKDIHFSPVGGIFFERLSLQEETEIR